jgi:hypothetical protein
MHSNVICSTIISDPLAMQAKRMSFRHKLLINSIPQRMDMPHSLLLTVVYINQSEGHQCREPLNYFYRI